MSYSPLTKFALASLMVICSSAFAASDDKNYAYQLALTNCGGYNLAWIELQRKPADATSWSKVETFVFGSGKGNGNRWCVDASKYPDFDAGDNFRLRVGIEAGEKKNCDNTNYASPGSISGYKKYRRNMKMAGSTLNNNGCRSKGYSDPLGSNQCTKGGATTYTGACS